MKRLQIVLRFLLQCGIVLLDVCVRLFLGNLLPASLCLSDGIQFSLSLLTISLD